MKNIFAALVLMFPTILSAPVFAQAQTSESVENRKKDQSAFSVPVIVSDREGRYVPGLKKEDFSVYRDGVKQEIASFATYDEPISVALLLDTSGSTGDVAKKIKRAAGNFIGLLNPQDKCLLATFDNQVKILSPLTADRRALENSLDKIKSSGLGGTLMYNAVAQVAGNSFAGTEGRKVIVLLTDGKDFGSGISKEELLAQFEESDVLIYTVFYRTGAISADATTGKRAKSGKKSGRRKNPLTPAQNVYVPTEDELTRREQSEEAEAIEVLKKMSDATAGRFYLSDAPGLEGIFKKLAGELREQYLLGLRSKNGTSDANARNIIVKVSRPDAVVRVRGKLRAE